MSDRKGQVVRAGAQVFTGSAVIRLFGIVRAVCVARLLVPRDLGRFALAATAMSTLDALTDPALGFALVQRQTITSTTAQTVWTALLVRGAAITAAGLALAPWLASTLHAPGAVTLIRVLAIGPLLTAMASPAPLLRARDLDLQPEVFLELAVAAVELLATVGFVLATRSEWGLVGGLLLGAACRVVGSYLIRGFHPGLHIDREELLELMKFGRWIFLANGLWFGTTSGDDLLVGRFAGVGPLGLYRLAYRLGHLPLSEVSDSIQRVLFPALSRSFGESTGQIGHDFRRSLVLAAGLSAPITFVLVALGPDLVHGLLGSKWDGAARPLQIVAFAGLIRALSGPASSLFMAVGRPRLDTILTAISAVTLLISVSVLVGPFGIEGASVGVVIAALAPLPFLARALGSVGVAPIECAGVVAGRLPLGVVAGLTAAVVALLIGSSLVALICGSSLAGVAWLVCLRRLDRPLYDELTGMVRLLRSGTEAPDG